ncbi:MAG TPA: MMPL family transporter [Gammaproteobacteria bacterium]|nr:MMPL family transporter [Gammaproteobacteria bacterium]
MYSLRYRLARWTLAHRGLAWAAFALITAFFAAGLPKVKLQTIFSDLLPQDDPFVQVYKDHPGFGNPLTVAVMIKRKHGDIYNAETLAKVWQLTRDIDLAPGVDHDLILSIASTKARYSESTANGIDMRPLMEDRPPASAEELARFRTLVEKSPNTRVFLISRDDSATLLTATFIERLLDYGEAFDYVQKLVEAARDADHEVHVAGQPMLIGWVYQYETQMIGIFAATVGLLVLALALYMRNTVGIVTPIITSATAGIWAFGLVGWLDVSIEPLLMVVPLLLTARSFSHSVQFTERFYEVYAQVGDRVRAAEITMSVMMAPSVVGIITDILGIAIVGFAPIPAMVRHAIFCGMWAVWLIPTGVVLISLLLASLPAPANVRELVGRGAQSGAHRRFERMMRGVARLSTGRGARVTAIVVVIGAALAIFTAAQIRIGNPVEGTNLFWHDSEFNTAVRAINAHFPGVNTLEIVLEGKDPDSLEFYVQKVEMVQTAQRLQRYMESVAAPPRATLSFADYMAEGNRLFNGGHTKWLPLDPVQEAMSAAAFGVTMGSSAKNFSNLVDEKWHHATVSLWYPDNRQDTVDRALADARAAVAAVGEEHGYFRVRLATGTIPLQQAVNLVIERYHWVVTALMNVFILITCTLAYRSLLAGALLLVPVNLANQVLYAAMHLLGVGLDVNSMIVAAIGLGVGIDYGIYLLSRICEEYHAHADWARAIAAALATTGKAILFTATVMVLGIAPWYFLSELKFVADMGLLIIVIMTINMVLALIVLPLLVWFVRPRFAARRDLLVGEGYRLEEFTTATEAR